MPGGRLTDEDRRRIAAGLADGLGYAEIARHLGRPTSTISREVARNGRPGDYLPERAQQAASRRARRRKLPPTAGAAPDGRPTGDALRGFEDQFAAVLGSTGFPRMSARVFVCLLTSPAANLTAAELVHRVGVSPGSVSKAIRYLEAMELVARRSEAGSRRERYLVVDDVWQRAWRTDAGMHTQVAAAARRGAEILGLDTPAGARLQRMGQFFAWLGDQMAGSQLLDVLVQDAMTVLAALVHAARPLTTDELALALALPRARVADAVRAIEQRPALADPLALTATEPGAYGIAVRSDRLSVAQRESLRAVARPR
jgi:DNA-binding transcriptional regulator GbsR (MarR family)